jgi:hypothetical protein
MKRSIQVAFGIVAILFMLNFAANTACYYVKTGVVRTEERKVDPFTSIGLSIPANLVFTQGSPQQITIEADEADLINIVTEVHSNSLEIKSKHNMHQYGNVKIKITIPEIERLSIAGSGDIIAGNAIKSKKMHCEIAGSGDIKIDELSADEVFGEIAGSGDIQMGGGNIEGAVFSIAGSGDIHCYNLKSNNVKVDIAGSGNCEVNCSGKLKVSIAGSGDVYYKGKPVFDSESVGSGGIHNAN